MFVFQPPRSLNPEEMPLFVLSGQCLVTSPGRPLGGEACDSGLTPRRMLMLAILHIYPQFPAPQAVDLYILHHFVICFHASLV